MAISTRLAIARIVPVHSSRRNKEHQLYPNYVALTQSGRASSPISFPPAKASRAALEIIRTISGKGDGEVQNELDRLQKACHMLKGFFGDIILVLVATNPILRLLCDIMTLDNRFLRWSSFAACYGALRVLNGFVKVLWNLQPIWGYNIIMGFLIYKANMRNMALYRKGRYPVWFVPLFVLASVMLVADGFVPMIWYKWMPVNIIWAVIEFIASVVMLRLVVRLIEIFYYEKSNFRQMLFD